MVLAKDSDDGLLEKFLNCLMLGVKSNLLYITGILGELAAST